MHPKHNRRNQNWQELTNTCLVVFLVQNIAFETRTSVTAAKVSAFLSTWFWRFNAFIPIWEENMSEKISMSLKMLTCSYGHLIWSWAHGRSFLLWAHMVLTPQLMTGPLQMCRWSVHSLVLICQYQVGQDDVMFWLGTMIDRIKEREEEEEGRGTQKIKDENRR